LDVNGAGLEEKLPRTERYALDESLQHAEWS
jgi:hypothetical protein